MIEGKQIKAGTVTDTQMATDVKIGSLSALTTTNKNSVVEAINEVDAIASAGGGFNYGLSFVLSKGYFGLQS